MAFTSDTLYEVDKDEDEGLDFLDAVDCVPPATGFRVCACLSLFNVFAIRSRRWRASVSTKRLSRCPRDTSISCCNEFGFIDWAAFVVEEIVE